MGHTDERSGGQRGRGRRNRAHDRATARRIALRICRPLGYRARTLSVSHEFLPDWRSSRLWLGLFEDPGNPLASGSNGANSVTVAANGNILGTSTTGANGYYYVFAPAGSAPSGAELVAYTQANATTGAANAATYTVSLGAANTSTVNVTGNWQVDLAGSSAGSLSALNAADAAAAGSLAPSTFVLPNRQIDFGPGNFALDANVSLSGTLALEGAGSVTEPSGEITAGSLLLAGGSFALGSANNSVGTLAAAVANLSLTVGPTLTVGTVADSSNVVIAGATSFGTANLTSTSGGITLASPINVPEEFGPVSLTAAGDIVQQSGASINATNLAMNSSGGGITLDAAINATGSASLTAGGGAGILQQTGADITTQAGLTMTAATGPITLGALVNSAGPVSLTSAGVIVQQSGASINATNVGMNSTGGGIALGAPINATGSASFTAGGGAGILQQTGAGITAQAGLTMAATTGPIALDALVDPAGPVSLTAFGDIVEGAGARGSPRPRSAQFPRLGWSSSPPPTMSFRYPVRRRSASPSPTLFPCLSQASPQRPARLPWGRWAELRKPARSRDNRFTPALSWATSF